MTTPTTTGDLGPGLKRTLTPYIVGLLGSWLTRQGLDINDDLLSAFLVFAYGYGYYFVVRLGELYGNSKWSYLLGLSTTRPAYVEPPATVSDAGGTQQIVTPEEPVAPPASRAARASRAKKKDSGEGVVGIFGAVLFLIGVVLLLLAAFRTESLSITGLVLTGVGVLCMYVDGVPSRRR